MARADYSGRSDQRKAAMKRLQDARVLLEQGRYRGAMYLAGYAVECKLKAVAMEIYDCWTLRQLIERWDVDENTVFTHGLEALVNRLPIQQRFRQSPVWRDFAVVNRWMPAWRYNPHNGTCEAAKNFISATHRVYKWLDANRA